MAIENRGRVEEIETVQDPDGNPAKPANAAAQGDFPNLMGDSYTTGSTTEEQLPSNEIPVGSEVMVIYDSGNASNVYVGPQGHTAFPLMAEGDYFTTQVNDTSEIYVQADNAGDSVTLVWEA